MERLEHKKISGITYYYYSGWGWKNGKCRRLWQKYLGRIEDIVKAVEGGGPEPKYAEIFQWGLPSALWKECNLAKVIEEVDGLCTKRHQGLSTGQYIAIAAINRAICPSSKKSMWEWFSQTVLLRYLLNASQAALTSQRFWYHMDKIDAKSAQIIWENIMKGVVKRENIALSSISYDGTNFYTFIDTFNMKCKIAKRGKNKQGRNNLRQVLFTLRKTIPEVAAEAEHADLVPLLVTDRKTIQINPAAAIQVDSQHLVTLINNVKAHDHPNLAACQTCWLTLQEAAALYQGSFLQNFYLDDSNLFEDWAIQVQLNQRWNPSSSNSKMER